MIFISDLHTSSNKDDFRLSVPWCYMWKSIHSEENTACVTNVNILPKWFLSIQEVKSVHCMSKQEDMWVCVCTCVFVCVCLQTDTESHRSLPAFTGTLRTIPRDIRVGYVTAIPKFNTILNAEIKNKKIDVMHAQPWFSILYGLSNPSFSEEAGV